MPRSSRSLLQVVAAVVLLTALLTGCSGGSTVKGPILVPLKVLGASVQVNPAQYAGPCSGTQNLTFTATLTANPSNAGGVVHYVWTIDHATTASDVTFGPGEVSKTVSRSYAYTIPADSGPELHASIATTSPNAVSAPDTVFAISCTVDFQIADVSVTMQPWSTDCGPHTFGWFAVLTAPWNNSGGQVAYTWKYADGSTQDGTVTFAPGQITATVATSRSYTVVPAGTEGYASPARFNWPVITPAQIVTWLYVTSPNAISDYATLDHYSC